MRFKRNHNYEIVDETKNKKKHISKEPMMALLLSIDKTFLVAFIYIYMYIYL